VPRGKSIGAEAAISVFDNIDLRVLRYEGRTDIVLRSNLITLFIISINSKSLSVIS
jgi:hypothetical protein